eukprot:g44951.t1
MLIVALLRVALVVKFGSGDNMLMRKQRKNQRERARRLDVKDQMERLCRLIHIPLGTHKAKVLQHACEKIESLQKGDKLMRVAPSFSSQSLDQASVPVLCDCLPDPLDTLTAAATATGIVSSVRCCQAGVFCRYFEVISWQTQPLICLCEPPVPAQRRALTSLTSAIRPLSGPSSTYFWTCAKLRFESDSRKSEEGHWTSGCSFRIWERDVVFALLRKELWSSLRLCKVEIPASHEDSNFLMSSMPLLGDQANQETSGTKRRALISPSVTGDTSLFSSSSSISSLSSSITVDADSGTAAALLSPSIPASSSSSHSRLSSSVSSNGLSVDVSSSSVGDSSNHSSSNFLTTPSGLFTSKRSGFQHSPLFPSPPASLSPGAFDSTERCPSSPTSHATNAPRLPKHAQLHVSEENDSSEPPPLVPSDPLDDPFRPKPLHIRRSRAVLSLAQSFNMSPLESDAVYELASLGKAVVSPRNKLSLDTKTETVLSSLPHKNGVPLLIKSPGARPKAECLSSQPALKKPRTVPSP